jgi:hypothetical protein
MALKTDWHSRLPILISLYLIFPILVGVGIFCFFYYAALAMDELRELSGRKPLFVGGVAQAFALGVATLSTLVPMFILGSLRFKDLRKRGPIDFDRDAGCVRFGPVAEQQTRSLKDIASFELYPRSSVTIYDAIVDESPSAKKPPAWLSAFFRWAIRLDERCYQLDLVYTDGTRLYLTAGRKPEPIQDVARQLAEFVKVPLIDWQKVPG